LPGHSDRAVTLHLGYGRTRSGRIGSGVGFNAYALLTTDNPAIATGLVIHKTGRHQALAVTHGHHSMEGRDIVRSATLQQFEENPKFSGEESEAPPADETMYPAFKYDGYAWGMAIDMNACVGCNACVVACQSENNIPIVGKDQVTRGREMHWI